MADFEKPWNTKNETSGRIRHQIIAKYEENMILKFTFKTFGYEFIRQAKLKILTA